MYLPRSYMLERADRWLDDFWSIANLLNDTKKIFNSAVTNDVDFVLYIIAAQVCERPASYHDILVIGGGQSL